MKEHLEDLIQRYENRIKTLDEIIMSNPERSKIRILTKKGVYQNVVRELKQLLEDFENQE